MKADTFLNAVGMIDDRYLDVDTPRKAVTHRKWTKWIVSVAAAAALIICPLPALTAFGVDSAYNVLYHIAPSVAQTFKPVQKTCEDHGIEMTVISAERIGSEASVYLAMHDTTGTCPDGEWDLYDSYHINVPSDMTGHCSFSEYDADTHTAYFVVHLETMDGSTMPEGKITFSVQEMLLGKEETNAVLEAIDMSSIPYEPQTMTLSEISGGSSYDELPDPQEYRFLIPSKQAICTPTKGVSVESIGYIDGTLHILTRYDDIPHTDNHGYIELVDQNGNMISEKTQISFSYWDTAHRDSYTEQIIPVSYDLLEECTLQGKFVTAQDYTSGDWEITFSLE
ncbi:MAG: DUF4179 domain-containing protein [Oscillospiraceae bacterium]|nr:DUF4179 domain-containing protein [Oscillospiraceae bacterium]